MKKPYQFPQMTLIEMSKEDIIVTSTLKEWTGNANKGSDSVKWSDLFNN